MNYPQGPGPYPPNAPPQHGGQPQYGQPPYGQPQYGQPPYGQPQYGQPPGPYHPHYPQAPPSYPPPQPVNVQSYAPQGHGQPAEGIAVTTRFFPLSFMLALFKPKVVVDGYETPAGSWGRIVVPARPGPHHVHVHVPYLWRLGGADTSVEVYPGRMVELEYKAPVAAFSAGSLGAPPQKYNGVGILIGIFAVSLFFAVVFPLIMMIASR
jgi:hypothetical protein